MEITKEIREDMKECLNDIMVGIPKTKAGEFIGNFNELFLFIGSVETVKD